MIKTDVLIEFEKVKREPGFQLSRGRLTYLFQDNVNWSITPYPRAVTRYRLYLFVKVRLLITAYAGLFFPAAPGLWPRPVRFVAFLKCLYISIGQYLLSIGNSLFLGLSLTFGTLHNLPCYVLCILLPRASSGFLAFFRPFAYTQCKQPFLRVRGFDGYYTLCALALRLWPVFFCALAFPAVLWFPHLLFSCYQHFLFRFSSCRHCQSAAGSVSRFPAAASWHPLKSLQLWPRLFFWQLWPLWQTVNNFHL